MQKESEVFRQYLRVMKKPIKTIEKMANGDAVVLVALGDSLTSGWMVAKGYPDFLRENLANLYPCATITLLNSGSPGDGAQDGFYRLDSDVLAHYPDCVLVQFGLNDVFCGYSPQQFSSLLRKIILKIKQEGSAEIVLLSSSYFLDAGQNGLVELFYEQIEKIADEYSLAFVAVHKYWLEEIAKGVPGETLVQYDGVHPTVAGYEMMARAVTGVFMLEGVAGR